MVVLETEGQTQSRVGHQIVAAGKDKKSFLMLGGRDQKEERRNDVLQFTLPDRD